MIAAGALAGCGDEGSDEPEEASPDAVQACLEAEGLEPEVVTTEETGTTTLVVDVSRNAGITVSFFGDPADAPTYVEDENLAAGAGLNANTTELAGPTTAVRSAGNVDAELETVHGCLA
jgi:hypothetical protein